MKIGALFDLCESRKTATDHSIYRSVGVVNDCYKPNMYVNQFLSVFDIACLSYIPSRCTCLALTQLSTFDYLTIWNSFLCNQHVDF